MKEFNIEEARAGKPVCTRDGRKVRIMCFEVNHPDYPIAALVEAKDSNGRDVEILESYDISGKYYYTGRCSNKDLMMAGEKHEGWANIYESNGCRSMGSQIFNSRKEAEEMGKMPPACMATAKIEWEE